MIEKYTILAKQSPKITALTLIVIIIMIFFGFYAVHEKYKVTKEGIEPTNSNKNPVANCSKIHSLERTIDSVIAYRFLGEINNLQATFKEKSTIENREKLIHHYAIVVQLNRYRFNDLKLLEDKCKNGESFDENFKTLEVSVTSTIEKTTK
jgi:hypothetical protein